MDEIEKRLREATDACITSFENWTKQGKSLEARESLMETMHEVRKVIARVEIEIAISERDRLGSRPIAIPPHRSSRKASGEEYEQNDDMNMMQPEMSSMRQNMGETRRPQNRDGGSRDGGRGRRPMGGQRSSGANPAGNGNNNAGNDSNGNSNSNPGNNGGESQP